MPWRTSERRGLVVATGIPAAVAALRGLLVEPRVHHVRFVGGDGNRLTDPVYPIHRGPLLKLAVTLELGDLEVELDRQVRGLDVAIERLDDVFAFPSDGLCRPLRVLD